MRENETLKREKYQAEQEAETRVRNFKAFFEQYIVDSTWLCNVAQPLHIVLFYIIFY